MLAIAIGMRLQLSVLIVAMNDNTTSPNPNIPVSPFNILEDILGFILNVTKRTLLQNLP